MRKVVLGLGISLNGYVDFLFMPKDYSMAPFFKTIGASIMGRKTLDAGLRMSGGSLPKSPYKYYVMSRSKPPGSAMAWCSRINHPLRWSVRFGRARARISG